MGGRKGHDRHQGSRGPSLFFPGPKPREGKAEGSA